MNKSTTFLNEQIIRITNKILNEMPEVYAKLQEMPITVPNSTATSVEEHHLQKYLDSLHHIYDTMKSNPSL